MIKIYKYDSSRTWFKDVINDSTLKGKKRDIAIEDAIKEHGAQISIVEYFKDWNRNSYCKDYCYACYGEAENSIERLVNAEINYDEDLTYLNARNNHPEDLIERRTSWGEMKGYADGLYWFINSIISDVVEDKIITPQVANEVEPKFKVGDWIANDYCAGKIIALTDDAYLLDSEQGIPFSCEHNAHLWTIEDAQDGEVLVSQYDKPFIYNGNHNSFYIGSYCGISTESRFNVATEKCRWTENVNIHPATQEQCDFLFQKMHEAGYEWNAEKKELKKIEHTCKLDNSYDCVTFPFKAKVKSSGKIVTIYDGQLSQDGKEWTKYQSNVEDGFRVYQANDLELVCEKDECEIEHIEHGKYYYCIKDYYSGGHKRASKGEVVQALKGMSMMALGVRANEYFIPVKCIRSDKPAWNEEDEINYNYALTACIYYGEVKGYADTETHQKTIDWIKSIKDRIQPQNAWKPSDEQLIDKDALVQIRNYD